MRATRLWVRGGRNARVALVRVSVRKRQVGHGGRVAVTRPVMVSAPKPPVSGGVGWSSVGLDAKSEGSRNGRAGYSPPSSTVEQGMLNYFYRGAPLEARLARHHVAGFVRGGGADEAAHQNGASERRSSARTSKNASIRFYRQAAPEHVFACESALQMGGIRGAGGCGHEMEDCCTALAVGTVPRGTL